MSQSDDEIVPQLMQMITGLGFLHLKNVEGFDEDDLLKDMKEFHSMADDAKSLLYRNQFNKENENFYFGLTPIIDNDPSHKEYFDMGTDYSKVDELEKKQPLIEETPFPSDNRYSHLKEKYTNHYEVRQRIGMKLLALIAQGLGKDKTFFDRWFARD
jgi:isopenicillin N synthase-like dioxygenase